MHYEAEYIRELTPDHLVEVLAGETHLPVTVQLLDVVREEHHGEPNLTAWIAQALDAPLIDPARLEWLAGYASQVDDHSLWVQAATHPLAGFDLMGTAPIGEFTLNSLQAFVWKHTLATGHLWSDEEVGRLRVLSEQEAMSEPSEWMTAASAAQQALGSASALGE